MNFFKKIVHFFDPPKKSTSMSAIKDALKAGRVRARDHHGRYVSDDPLTKEDEAWLQGKD